jgi:SAM-dependent methyltransferase
MHKLKLQQKRVTMDYTSPTAMYYLDLRRKSLAQGLSKARVIPYILFYLNQISTYRSIIPSVIDLGCGEGHMLNQIKTIYEKSQPSSPVRFIGVDYNKSLIKRAGKNYPEIELLNLDIVNDSLKILKNKFDIVMIVNTLHEVFSFHSWNGDFNEKNGKKKVIHTLKNITQILKRNGKLVLFDGVEHPDKPNKKVIIKLLKKTSKDEFLRFVKEYQPIKIKPKWLSDSNVEITTKEFTRFVTKLIFLNTPSWEMEKEEMYQYFTKKEFENVYSKLNLQIDALNLLSPNLGLWNSKVKIISRGCSFPYEHIMITGFKK